jgi:uncharacterized protein YdeI (YjbR/CyaY-like superfamily)
MFQTNPQVDAFVNGAKKWQAEFKKLREFVLATDLSEDFKWMHPCYSYEGKNVLILQGFKEYCAILFVKGVLLKDPAGVMITQTENVQSARQVRFTELDEIVELEPVLKAYIQEAIEIEKAGLKVDLKPTAEFKMAEEFKQKLDADAALKTAFESLTPGRQRAYLLHFSAPKQSATRLARVEKCLQQILAGKGLND